LGSVGVRNQSSHSISQPTVAVAHFLSNLRFAEELVIPGCKTVLKQLEGTLHEYRWSVFTTEKYKVIP
jgi:hypothetical protein